MSTITSSLRTSELRANSVYGWKAITIEQGHNHENDRTWCAEAPVTSAIDEHRQNRKSVMVWAEICSTGKTPLVFADEEGKNWPKRLPLWHPGYRGGSWGQSPLRPTAMDASTRFRSSPQSEIVAAGLLQDYFPDFITSAEWPPYSQISTVWITAFDKFWRPGPVQSTAKIWRLCT